MLLIQQWRKVRGMTQAQLARQLSITPSRLSRYETGRCRLRADLWLEIAQVLQVPLALLYVEDTSPDSDDNLVPSTMPFPCEENTRPEMEALLLELLQDQLQRLRQLDPDKPLKEQAIYEVAVAVTTWSRLLWEIIGDIVAKARLEGHLLQQALEQIPRDPQDSRPGAMEG